VTERCKRCGSYAINEHHNGRVKGRHADLCRVVCCIRTPRMNLRARKDWIHENDYSS